MSGQGQTARQTIRDMKAQDAERGDPVHEGLERKVRKGGGNGSGAVVNITDYGASALDVSPGDQVVIDVYRDQIVIRLQE